MKSLPLLPTWTVYHYTDDGVREGATYGLTEAEAKALAASKPRSHARQDRDTGDRPIFVFDRTPKKKKK